MNTVIAGIDEAGLGPTLGPLVTASFALLCPDDWTPSCPWEKLASVVERTPTKKSKNIAVCDSKLLHPHGGVQALANTVAAFNTICHGEAFPSPTASEPMHPCYSTQLPAIAPESCADAIRAALDAAGAAVAHYRTHLLHEPGFNAVLNSGLNKNQLLLDQTGRHITDIVEAFAKDHPVRIVVDKQGGRNSYAAFLAQLFPGAWIRELESGRERSCYRLRPYDHEVSIVFQAKADRLSFAAAAASIAAKFARECAMARLNAWFSDRVPGLKATAGYPQDARRWLADVGGRGGELRVELLIRNK